VLSHVWNLNLSFGVTKHCAVLYINSSSVRSPRSFEVSFGDGYLESRDKLSADRTVVASGSLQPFLQTSGMKEMRA